MPYRVLDLFSGACGGWSLGLESAGFETVAACEVDPWRREQYARNFPRVRLYDDVRTVTAERLRADGCWPLDVVAGSPPCQDASTANTTGRGVDGEHTGLFFEWLRIVGEIRPRWALAENVPGIRNRGIDRILGGLEALGYARWPLVVGAANLGANHIRKRLVLVAFATALPHANGEGQHGGARNDSEVDGRGEHGGDVANAEKDRWGEGRPGRSNSGGAGEQDEFGAWGNVANPAQVGQHPRRSREASGRAGSGFDRSPTSDADAHCASLAQWESERGDAREECATAQRGRLQDWGGNFTEYLDGTGQGDDGVSSAVARACISAYGDSFLPQEAALIGRAIFYVDFVLGGARP